MLVCSRCKNQTQTLVTNNKICFECRDQISKINELIEYAQTIKVNPCPCGRTSMAIRHLANLIAKIKELKGKKEETMGE